MALSPPDVQRLLEGRIKPVELPASYRLGLLGCAAGLVLLQALYLGLAVLTLALSIGWLMLAPWITEYVHINFYTIILIVGPPIAGIISAFFLFKPLLSRSPKPDEVMELRREDAETLFAFVDEICRAIGAPAPKRINVNLDVNASASLRRGWRSMFSRDLTLTIGLPLVAGLTQRQFAGVMAHEFGHFTQTMGMRLYFLIGSIRNWFLRVAYERDKWDQWLDEKRTSSQWWISTVMNLSALAVLLSRWILQKLLVAATWISAWFSRQMEFDADRHEAALVGGATHAETSLKMPMLAAASQEAWRQIQNSWRARELVTDFATHVAVLESRFYPETRDGITQSVMDEVTERWATHPSTAERIKSVKGIEGMVGHALDAPALDLVGDFEALSARATRYHYGQTLGEECDKGVFISSDQLLKAAGREAALGAVFPMISMPSRWFVLENAPSNEPIRLSDKDPSATYWELLTESLDRFAALQFLRVGGKIDPASFRLTSSSLDVVEREAAQSRSAVRREITELRKLYRGNGSAITSGSSVLRAAYSAITNEQSELFELRHDWVAMGLLMDNLHRLPEVVGTSAKEKAATALRARISSIVARLYSVDWPLSDTPSTVGRQLLEGGSPEVLDSMDAHPLAAMVLNRADLAAEALLGELCVASTAEEPATSPAGPA